MPGYLLSHLDELEAEGIHVIREVAAQFENPVMLYSVGKDSSVMVHLARKAFYPAAIPFPLLHVDTGMKFRQMYEFRDRFVRSIGARLIVHRNERAMADGIDPFTVGTTKCCRLLKTEALLDALSTHGFDAAMGGARREEERSRAKERIFSFRDSHGGWDPRSQRPELWGLYNGLHGPGESFRVFPLSNWTELDVWTYIHREGIEVVPMYFAARRRVIRRGGLLFPADEGPIPMAESERVEEVMCRYRTLGCYPCTAAVQSTATTVPEIIRELERSRLSERVTRLIDHDTDGSMELKKRSGYF